MASIEDRLLHWLRPPADVLTAPYQPPGGQTASMLARHFGAPLWAACAGKLVLDFGCGDGPDALALAQHGARQVVGLDLDSRVVARATERARATAARSPRPPTWSRTWWSPPTPSSTWPTCPASWSSSGGT